MRINSTKAILGRPKGTKKADVKVLSETAIDFGLQLTQREDGSKELHAVFPRKSFEPFRLSLTFLLNFPNLWKPIAIGYRLHFDQLSDVTKRTNVGNIRVGICKFLVETAQQNASLADLTEEFWNSFVRWLNRSDATVDGVYSHQTRVVLYNTMRGILESLAKTNEYRELCQVILGDFPSKVWDGTRRKGSPRKRLPSVNLENMKAAAAFEVVRLEERYREGLRLIAEGVLTPVTRDAHYVVDKATFLARVARIYPGVLPLNPELMRGDKVIATTSKHLGGIEAYCGYLYPSSRDLIPLVLLLTVALALNPETVLTLNSENISRIEILGRAYVVIKGEKDRAAEDPVITVPMDYEISLGVSIGRVLDLAEKITARVRHALLISSHRGRIFIFVGESSSISRPRGYGATYDGAVKVACSDIAFTHNLKRFIKDHSLEYFSLVNLRPTVLDDIVASTGDLKAAQALGQQKSPWTLLNHYTSDGTKQRLSEQLGEASFLLRERWWGTNGLIDPRVDRLGFAKNRSSATPGFYCLDPFDSPRPGQRPDRLCAAYGECPDCPLAAASNQVTDVASYLSLRKRVAVALSSMNETAWRAQWAAVFSSLEALISSLPKKVVDEALDFEVKLPALPELG